MRHTPGPSQHLYIKINGILFAFYRPDSSDVPSFASITCTGLLFALLSHAILAAWQVYLQTDIH